MPSCTALVVSCPSKCPLGLALLHFCDLTRLDSPGLSIKPRIALSPRVLTGLSPHVRPAHHTGCCSCAIKVCQQFCFIGKYWSVLLWHTVLSESLEVLHGQMKGCEGLILHRGRESRVTGCP